MKKTLRESAKAKPAIVKNEGIFWVWRCSGCGKTVVVDEYELIEVGEPMCSDCDVEMERLSKVRTSDGA